MVREVIGDIEDLIFGLIVFFHLNGSQSGIIGTLCTIYRLVVACTLVEFLDGRTIVAFLEV